MNIEMNYKRKKSLTTAQIIGAVFGLIFAATDSYKGFWEIVGAWILGPLAFAAMFRFCVRAYQFGKTKLGTRVQGPMGEFVVIDNPGRGVFAAVIALFLPVGLITSFANVSQALVVIVAVVLLIVGTLFCVLDIKFMIQYKRQKKVCL